METVVLDGVEYLKASAAAKRFRYTSDYIGQLCRGKKIDARLVGRTWFVNPASIEEHKEGRYQNLRAGKSEVSQIISRDSDSVIKTKLVRVQVPSPIKSKFLADAAHALQLNTSDRERSLRVSYEPDEGHLIPHIDKHHTPPPHRINVDPADAKKLAIKKNKEVPTSLVAEALPDVALSGKLSVQSIEDSVESEEELVEVAVEKEGGDTEKTFIHNVISDNVKEEDSTNKKVVAAAEVSEESNQRKTVKILTNRRLVKSSVGISKNVTASGLDAKIATYNQAETISSSKANTPSFIPSSVRQVQSVRSMSPLFSYAPLFTTLFAVLVVAFLLSMSTTIIFSEAGYQTQLDVQVANLLEIISQKN